MEVKIRNCPKCARHWPFPKVPTPTKDWEQDYTCQVCLVADVAALQREVARLTALVSDLSRPRDHGNA